MTSDLTKLLDKWQQEQQAINARLLGRQSRLIEALMLARQNWIHYRALADHHVDENITEDAALQKATARADGVLAKILQLGSEANDENHD